MMIKTTNRDSWQKDIMNGTVLVDFYASWCGPCKAMSPTVDKISSELLQHIVSYKIDVDAIPDAATRFSIRSVPVVMIIENGVEKMRFSGFTPYQKLKEGLANYLVT